MKIKFISGWTGYGGSTIVLLEHCKLLQEAGYNVEFYGEQEWHLNRFFGSRLLYDLVINPDDILVYHYMELETRPICLQCILFLHEKELYNIRSRKISGFDQIIFASQTQRDFHQIEGKIVNNPMLALVDIRQHYPPNQNIAGVVGTICERKNTHISIQKALEDNRDLVYVFGNIGSNEYYEEKIQPLLSDRVMLRDLVDPSNLMYMYNQFDVLYHMGEDESACLVLGECRLLNKPVIKSDKLFDYPLLDNKEILNQWKSVFNDTEI